MKTKVFYFLTLAIVALTLASCNHSVKPSKNKITKKYSVDAFNKIESNASVNIVFTQGSDTKVEAYGPDNYIADLQVVSKDSTLSIMMDKKILEMIKGSKVVVSVTSPNLYSVNQQGAGRFVLEDSVKVNEILIKSNGVGDIKTDALIANHIHVSTAGVGNISLNGQAGSAKYYMDGVGNLNAKNMIVSDVIVEQNGVGNVSCYATGTINITTHGVGNVTYYGNPQVTGLKKSGVGSVNSK